MEFRNLRICLLVLITCSFIYLSSAPTVPSQKAEQKRHGEQLASKYYYANPCQPKKEMRETVKKDMIVNHVSVESLHENAKKDILLKFPDYEYNNWETIAEKFTPGNEGGLYYTLLIDVEREPLKYEKTPIPEEKQKLRYAYMAFAPNIITLQFHRVFKTVPLKTKNYFPEWEKLKDELLRRIVYT